MFKLLSTFWNPFKTQYRVVLDRSGKLCPQVKPKGCVEWYGLGISKYNTTQKQTVEYQYSMENPLNTMEEAQAVIKLHQIEESNQGKIVFYETR